MSDEKNKAAAPKNVEAAQLLYVAFRDQVELPVHGGVSAWSRDTHGKDTDCAERGNWIVITTKMGRIRVPMTNVSFIREAT